MSLPRASAGLLRSRIRPSNRPARLPSSVRGLQEDQGGPGGQDPPPSKPGGPEALQRNWVPLAAAGLAVAAGFAYFRQEKPPSNVVERAQDKAEAAAQKMESARSDTLGEMSGRKKGGLEGFRSE